MKLGFSPIRTTACLFYLVVFTACNAKPTNQPRSIREEMNKIQANVWELYSLVWSPSEFLAESNEKRVANLLGELQKGFHDVDSSLKAEDAEPGFRISLLKQKELLAEARLNFEKNNKRLASRQLRAMASNCIGCHSRLGLQRNFFGPTPPIGKESLEHDFARAEYFFATRQFDAASESLFELGRLLDSRRLPQSYYAMKALKLWLVIETRVKNRPNWSADRLKEIADGASLSLHHQQVLQAWIEDFQKIAAQPKLAQPLFVEAKSLLGDNIEKRDRSEDEIRLVRTLRASMILHSRLRGQLDYESRREASYLLALVYQHLPIDTFIPLREVFFQFVSSNYPETAEGASASRMLSEYRQEYFGWECDSSDVDAYFDSCGE